jgi:hypothetical protein
MQPEFPSDESCQRLQKLLALKRHEVPPPGYFQQLPSHIISRIQDTQRISLASRWLARFESWLGRPAFAGACGRITGALLVGVFQTESSPLSGELPVAGGFSALPLSELHSQPKPASSPTQFHVVNTEGGVSSVSPWVEGPSPFARQFPSSRSVQRASFTPAQ